MNLSAVKNRRSPTSYILNSFQPAPWPVLSVGGETLPVEQKANVDNTLLSNLPKYLRRSAIPDDISGLSL